MWKGGCCEGIDAAVGVDVLLLWYELIGTVQECERSKMCGRDAGFATKNLEIQGDRIRSISVRHQSSRTVTKMAHAYYSLIEARSWT